MPGLVAIDYASALISGGLAIATAFRARRSFNRWAFVVGMLLFAAEAVFIALSRSTSSPEEIAQWQIWRMVTIAMIPGAWLFFSSSYARHKKFPFPTRRGFALALAIILPAAATYALSQHLILSVQLTTWGTQFLVKLANGGTALFGILLLSSIGVVMNLERTFRASVGTMRWRIKFMLLGLIVLNSVQFYVSSQAVLFHATATSILVIRSFALFVGCLCMARSFLRPGQFSIYLHPSHTALYR